MFISSNLVRFVQQLLALVLSIGVECRPEGDSKTSFCTEVLVHRTITVQYFFTLCK